jgi:hypothetical protein
MSDQERIELQMVQGYQDRLTDQRRAALQMQVEHYKRERAREALKVAWRPPEPQYSRIDVAFALGLVALLGIACGASAAWMMAY